MGETHDGSDAMSKADRDLIAAVRVLDPTLIVRPSLLKDWRAARLIETPELAKPSRGHGRAALGYPAGTAERVVDAKHILEWQPRVHDLNDVLLWLFLLGHDIDLVRVREAAVAAWERELRPIVSIEDHDAVLDALDHASQTYAVRTPLARLLRSIFGLKQIRSDSLPAGFISSLPLHLAGGEPNEKALVGVFAALAESETLRTFVRGLLVASGTAVSDSEVRAFLAPLAEMEGMRSLFLDAMSQPILSAFPTYLTTVPDEALVLLRIRWQKGVAAAARFLGIDASAGLLKTVSDLRKLCAFSGLHGIVALVAMAEVDALISDYLSRLSQAEIRDDSSNFGASPGA